MHTLKYVVNQSDFTVQTLRNVTEYLLLAKTINVAQVFLPSDVKDEIDKLNEDLNTAADMLSQKTSQNSGKIQRVFNAMYNFMYLILSWNLPFVWPHNDDTKRTFIADDRHWSLLLRWCFFSLLLVFVRIFSRSHWPFHGCQFCFWLFLALPYLFVLLCFVTGLSILGHKHAIHMYDFPWF